MACRQLGFASGAEAIISTTSALPGPAGVTDAVSSIVCNGTEDTLGDCIVVRRVDFISCAGGRDNCNVALVCAIPTGKPPDLFTTMLLVNRRQNTMLVGGFVMDGPSGVLCSQFI